MKIIVEADENQWLELETIKDVNWVRVENDKDYNLHADADSYFNFINKGYNQYYKLPVVFVNDASENTVDDKNVFQVNAWPGFLLREIWEIKGDKNEAAEKIISSLDKKAMWVKNEFVSARIISMIINEAYFAFEENVSSKEEINIAMKAGTGYPFGPFEWAEKIGVKNVYNILNNLSKSDKRYTPSESLKKDANI